MRALCVLLVFAVVLFLAWGERVSLLQLVVIRCNYSITTGIIIVMAIAIPSMLKFIFSILV